MGIILIVLLFALCGLLLGYLAIHLGEQSDTLVESIDQLLPQTQCAQCDFPGCRPYAVAIANGDANINQCPPGGQTTIDALAQLLGKDSTQLDTQYGETKPAQLARIIEADCIGCTLCLPACPVDAIMGAAQQMHTVIQQECTGCELCIAPCPVDCIEMINSKHQAESA